MLNTRLWIFIIINNELYMSTDSPMNTSVSRTRHFLCAVDRIAPLRSCPAPINWQPVPLDAGLR